MSQQCIGCFPRIEKGVAPACVRQCPGRAAWIGFLDDERGPVSRLVNKWKVALPLHAEWETKPNVYYIPPLSPAPLNPDGSFNEGGDRIPESYLRTLFGADVTGAVDTLKAEMEKRRRGEHSEVMDILIMYHWEECLGPFDRDPAEIVWASNGAG